MMDKLSEKTNMYCDVIDREVECILVRGQRFNMRADVYRCTRISSDKKTCNPCSNYTLGDFIPIPENAIKENGTLDLKVWMESIRATVELPVAGILGKQGLLNS